MGKYLIFMQECYIFALLLVKIEFKMQNYKK